MNVRVKTTVGHNYTEDRVVAVLYDGFQFGEFALTKTSETSNGRRTATIEVGEYSEFLVVGKSDF